MKQVVIFMSDFHLGKQDRMEEFYADDEFARLLEGFSVQYSPEPKKGKGADQVDLVLLGDVMDLWTTIMSPDEVNAPTADGVELYFPMNPNDRIALDGEIAKVEAVLDKHPLVFEALARFLADDPYNRQVIYIPGNHDHSVVAPEIQRLIRSRIIRHFKLVVAQEYKQFELGMRPAGLTAEDIDQFGELWGKLERPLNELQQRIKFQNYYYEPDVLKVYAEHGNQLTFGGAYRYELPDNWLDPGRDRKECAEDQFGKECAGYYELKLVWNRLERKSPDVDNVFMGALEPAKWPGIFWWLLGRGNFRYWNALKTFQTQYKYFEETDSVKKKYNNRSEIPAAVKNARRRMPSPLQSVLHLLLAQLHETKDEFWNQVPQMFRGQGDNGECPLLGERLDPNKVRTVVLGHSHQSQDRDITLKSGDKTKYYNTGSWIHQFEHGRGVVRQTWVVISREMMPDGSGRIVPASRVIDRKMVCRTVELPHPSSSPVSAEGVLVNPTLRKMTDVHVGDILLIRGNYGATIRRLLKSFEFLTLARSAFEMTMGWFNRYGTFSSWNHVALVYGSPHETAERDLYNDLLIIEAVPGAGVAIHGPQEYLEHPKEHDLAILRPTADWLDEWKNRVLLRRLALSRLEAHYDLGVILRQTIIHTVRSMDRRGRSAVAGLVKGGLVGVVFGLLILGVIIYFWPGQTDASWHALGTAFAATVKTIHTLFSGYTIILDDWLIKFFAGSAVVLVGVITFVTTYLILRLAVMGYLVATAAVGSVIGVLLVPVMAELSGNWQTQSPTWRWTNTVIWIGLFVGGIASTHALRIYLGTTIMVGDGLMSVDILLASTAFLIAVIVIWFGTLLTTVSTTIMECIFQFLAWLVTPVTRAITRIMARIFPLRLSPPIQSLDKQFICSGLAQDTLLRTAELLGDNPERVRAHPNVEWQDTLPKHFATSNEAWWQREKGTGISEAQSNRFRWVYLYLDGLPTHNPDKALIAQANPEPFDEGQRTLCWQAALCFRCAVLGLFLFSSYVYAASQGARPFPLLVGGAVVSLAGLMLGRVAQRKLALDPLSIRGRALTTWGQRLGGAALTLAVGTWLTFF